MTHPTVDDPNAPNEPEDGCDIVLTDTEVTPDDELPVPS